jgi:hypothetical protein
MSQTLFTAQTPTLDNTDDGPVYTMGTTFVSDVDGQILGVRAWAPSDATAAGWSGRTCSGLLYRYDDQAQLGRKDVTISTLGGWTTITFDTPIGIVAGTYYVAARHVVGSSLYVASGSFFAFSPLTNGHLTGPADGSPKDNGLFLDTGADPAFPHNHFSGGCYFVDPIFEPAGGASSPPIWGIRR